MSKQLSIRIEEPWLALADAIAKAESKPGRICTRTEAFRLAMARGLHELTATVVDTPERPPPLVEVHEPPAHVEVVVAHLKAAKNASMTTRAIGVAVNANEKTVSRWLKDERAPEPSYWPAIMKLPTAQG